MLFPALLSLKKYLNVLVELCSSKFEISIHKELPIRIATYY